MDIVYIKDLKINTIIGINDWERELKQTISLDVEMAADVKRAALTDQIEDALDYNAVARRLVTFVEASRF